MTLLFLSCDAGARDFLVSSENIHKTFDETAFFEPGSTKKKRRCRLWHESDGVDWQALLRAINEARSTLPANKAIVIFGEIAMENRIWLLSLLDAKPQ